MAYEQMPIDKTLAETDCSESFPHRFRVRSPFLMRKRMLRHISGIPMHLHDRFYSVSNGGFDLPHRGRDRTVQENQSTPEQQAKLQQELMLNYLRTVLKPSDARLQSLVRRVRNQQSEKEAAA